MKLTNRQKASRLAIQLSRECKERGYIPDPEFTRRVREYLRLAQTPDEEIEPMGCSPDCIFCGEERIKAGAAQDESLLLRGNSPKGERIGGIQI